MRIFPSVKRTKAKLLKEFRGRDILDVGCGRRKISGAVGIDRRIHDNYPADVQRNIDHDLTVFPWPIDDNTFDFVNCQHCIEHLPDTVRTMEEFSRITRPGGKVLIETPHYSWFEAFRHYEHYHQFTVGSFDYFLKDNRHYGTDFVLEEKKLYFDDLLWMLGIGFFANKFLRTYEKRFAFIFPATSFSVVLRIDK